MGRGRTFAGMQDHCREHTHGTLEMPVEVTAWLWAVEVHTTSCLGWDSLSRLNARHWLIVTRLSTISLCTSGCSEGRQSGHRLYVFICRLREDWCISVYFWLRLPQLQGRGNRTAKYTGAPSSCSPFQGQPHLALLPEIFLKKEQVNTHPRICIV